MFNRIKFFSFIALLWFGIILPYFFLQTTWGAKYAGQILSHLIPDYEFSIGKVSHSITHPYEITFENISIQSKTQANNFDAEKLIVGLNTNDLFQYHTFNYLFIENGDIHISSNIQDDFNAQILSLKNVSINYENTTENEKINLINIYGGIKPWNSQLLNKDINSQFDFTIEKANYNNWHLNSLIIQGNQTDRQLNFINFGGNIAQSAIIGKASILADHSLLIDQLKINKFNYQANFDNQLTKYLANIPKITIKKLSILNSSLKLPDFTIEKGNLEITHLNYNQGWQIDKSDLTFNAESLILYDQQFDNPLLQWHSDDNQLNIEKAIAIWNKGNFAFSGNLQNKILNVNSLIASGIHYELPNNWYNSLTKVNGFNELFTHIKIKQFTLMPSLIISTDPFLPFQFNAFETFGKNVEILSNANTLKLTGTVSIKAENGILNRVKLEKPDLILNFKPICTDLTFSSLVESGFLEGKGCLTTKEVQSFTINAHGINSKILSAWHMVRNPLESEKFTTELNGTLYPLNLDGVLIIDNDRYIISKNIMLDH